ncbi:alpha/beta hydrolase fold domain-containing protein [Streptomyces sp. 4F14]|uniref:alpha/beta hydrolase fold domain-containing protein n=1 Tax=Streptomyces sp. 4F14 TaxID=3394380 RepID=UPI003A85FCA9
MTIHLPSRAIPVPASISPEARAALARPAPTPVPYPALDDHPAWRARAAAQDRQMLAHLEKPTSRMPVDVAETRLDNGPTVYVATPRRSHEPTPVHLYLHGGGLTTGGSACCRAMGIVMAVRYTAPTWAVDYRMPPDHPYPTPLDDCLTAYRHLLTRHRPEDIVVGGDSAGGNLAAALLLRARDEGLPLPAAALLFSPELDLTESGDSFRTNLGLDPVLPRSLLPANLLYAAGHDLDDPYLSPLFGDFTKGFPPTLLTAGTRDLFLSNAVRMHRALRNAGIRADLHITEAAPHGGFFGLAPEDRAIEEEARRFLRAH